MLKSLVFSYLLLAFSCSSLVAKGLDSNRIQVNKNVVVLRGGTHFFWNTLGLSYERKLYVGRMLKPFLRIDYEYYAGTDYAQGKDFDLGSLQVGTLLGKGAHHAELAAGYARVMLVDDFKLNKRTNYLAYLGYRFEPPGGRIVFTGGLVHLVRGFPGIKLGLGFSF